MSMHARRELIWSQAKRYRACARAEKTVILNEFCQATGLNRKYAIGLLNRPPIERTAPAKRVRRSVYAAHTPALERLWEMSGRLCGKRLVAAIPVLIDAMARHGEAQFSPESRERLCRLSASTADRLLQKRRRRLGWRGKTMTRPGTLLKQQIAIRTFADWDDLRPGFFEVDLVAHCADSGHGDFAYTLTLTDVATGWTELGAIKDRSQKSVCDAIDSIRRRLPCPMLGIDSDNGAEFINHLLQKYCLEHRITFTRCRPYRKNDQCHVESKNWSVVRVHTGYWRYDTPDALKALRTLYSWLRLSVNFFKPSLKLKEKVRQGGKLTRRYDRAATPYQRLCTANVLSQEDLNELQDMFITLNPVLIHQRIQDAQSVLNRTASVRSNNEATNQPWSDPYVRQDASRGMAARVTACAVVDLPLAVWYTQPRCLTVLHLRRG